MCELPCYPGLNKEQSKDFDIYMADVMNIKLNTRDTTYKFKTEPLTIEDAFSSIKQKFK